MTVQTYAQQAAAAQDIPLFAKALLAGRGDKAQATQFAEMSDAPARVRRILQKAAVGASTSTDFGADLEAATRSYFGSLRTSSVFFRMLDSGFRRVPLRTRLGIVASNASGFIVGQGKPVPVSKLSLTLPELQPLLAAGLIVVTDDVARSLDAAANSLIGGELRAAVAATVDDGFFAAVIDGSTPSTVSAGATAANRQTDLKALLDVVATDANAKLFFAAAPDVANTIAVIDGNWHEMTPLGGEIVGLPALVSNNVPAGTLRLIDANQIAAGSDSIELEASDEATIEMLDSALVQDAAVGTGTSLVSMFQNNSTALMARVRFAAERTRDDAIAEITGIAWTA